MCITRLGTPIRATLTLLYTITLIVMDYMLYVLSCDVFNNIGEVSAPMKFTCTLKNTVCGSLRYTGTVLCSWEIESATFFNLILPNGTSVVIPGTQTSYSFEHICLESRKQDVFIASNCSAEKKTYNLLDLVRKHISNFTYIVDWPCLCCMCYMSNLC